MAVIRITHLDTQERIGYLGMELVMDMPRLLLVGRSIHRESCAQMLQLANNFCQLQNQVVNDM